VGYGFDIDEAGDEGIKGIDYQIDGLTQIDDGDCP
jgi:hypothetical protein